MDTEKIKKHTLNVNLFIIPQKVIFIKLLHSSLALNKHQTETAKAFPRDFSHSTKVMNAKNSVKTFIAITHTQSII